MKKSLIIIPASLLLASCVTSTFSGIRKGAVTSTSSTSISSKYEYCNGCEIFEFEVKKEHALSMKCIITTSSGEINFSICKKGEDSLFARSLKENGEFDVELPDYGNYKITVNMNEHSGSYSFDWSK